MGIIEKRHGAGKLTDEELVAEEERQLDPEVEKLKRPKLLLFNIALTVLLVLGLMFSIMSSHVLLAQ